jgi:hypothetical protein
MFRQSQKYVFLRVNTVMKITQQEHLKPNSKYTHMIQMPIQHAYNKIPIHAYMQLIPIGIHSNCIQVSNHYTKRLTSS